MTKEAQNKLFQAICNTYVINGKKLKFHNMELEEHQWEGYEEVYTRESAMCFDTIFLGLYNDDELELRASHFFHELGHVVDILEKNIPKFEDLPYYHFDEASAWRTGFQLADVQGFRFSKETINSNIYSLATYFKDFHPEKTPTRYLEEAIEYAFTYVKTFMYI